MQRFPPVPCKRKFIHLHPRIIHTSWNYVDVYIFFSYYLPFLFRSFSSFVCISTYTNIQMVRYLLLINDVLWLLNKSFRRSSEPPVWCIWFSFDLCSISISLHTHTHTYKHTNAHRCVWGMGVGWICNSDAKKNKKHLNITWTCFNSYRFAYFKSISRTKYTQRIQC